MNSINTLVLSVGWILTVFVGLLGIIILYKILDGSINLDKIISEPNGDASLSRFQFLIFTFVIALSLFFVIISQNPIQFPDIPGGVFALLGISGGSYLVSKGIQTSREAQKDKADIEKARNEIENAKIESPSNFTSSNLP